jgi:diacylglycerol O-acyltransferase / wax synthase
VVEPLTPSDASSLQAERGPVNMAVGGLLVFEAGAGTRHEAVAERLEERLHLVPRYRQRLDQPPLGISNPVWVDDDAFDLHWHLRRAALRGRAALPGYVAREMSRRLDRSRPLWELHVVEGLEGGARAIWVKMHHALVDGLAAIGIGMVLLDPAPDGLDIPPPDAGWHPRTFDRRSHLTRLARQPLERAQWLVVESTLRALDTSPRRAADDLRRATELVTELARQRPQAPMTSLNRTISPNRRFVMRSVGLGAVKAAGRAAGGTVNDVLLAAVAGALRRFVGPEEDLVALVPVSIRREGEEGGNRISMVFVDLPVTERDPRERVRRLGAQMRALRESAAVRAGALLVGATGAVPPVVSAVLVRAMGNVRANNLVVSNIPGPQQPFYLNGTRLREVYPAVPLNPANQGLTVGILSYDGRVEFGLLTDAALDADALGTALDESLADLLPPHPASHPGPGTGEGG